MAAKTVRFCLTLWEGFEEISGILKMKLRTVYVAEDDPFPELENFITDSLKR